MLNLEHSLKTRKGKAVAKCPVSDSFDDLMDFEQSEVFEEFMLNAIKQGCRIEEVMSHVPAEHFGIVAEAYIDPRVDTWSEEAIRGRAAEIGLDPDGDLETLKQRVSDQWERSNIQKIEAVAKQDSRITVKEDSSSFAHKFQPLARRQGGGDA